MAVKGWDANPKRMDKALYFLKEVHDVSSANSSEISYSSQIHVHLPHTHVHQQPTLPHKQTQACTHKHPSYTTFRLEATTKAQSLLQHKCL